MLVVVSPAKVKQFLVTNSEVFFLQTHATSDSATKRHEQKQHLLIFSLSLSHVTHLLTAAASAAKERIQSMKLIILLLVIVAVAGACVE